MVANIEDLEELLELFKKQTPSAPDWFSVIDQVVGVLLTEEIERRKHIQDVMSSFEQIKTTANAVLAVGVRSTEKKK